MKVCGWGEARSDESARAENEIVFRPYVQEDGEEEVMRVGGYEKGKRAKFAGNGGRTVNLSDGSRVRY